MKEISAHDLGEYRIQQLIDAAVRRGFTAKELEDMEESAYRNHPRRRKKSRTIPDAAYDDIIP
jgi:hypothetical protein